MNLMQNSDSHTTPLELLAPAGDWECVHAAIENGADAIYFGLDCGFNARHRAKNFGLGDLAEIGKTLRRRGVRGYVTMNTLVYPSEMDALADVIGEIAVAGIDAVLVQDFGVARLVRTICPELEIHASTQMSLTSAETIAVAQELAISRVVLARELSVREIQKIAGATKMPLEVFIHGALCVAYSGQCLTSESLGGRSANRGQCAQACRLPYDLICDGQDVPLGNQKYLISPQDLAGYAAIPELMDAGIASIKIEGRLKTSEYVANITSHYRAAIDEAIATRTVTISEAAKQEMELSFSRGFSPGWLEGNDHKRLVPGESSAKRGIGLGEVLEVTADRIKIHVSATVRLGDGIAIEDTNGRPTQGSRVFELLDEHNNPIEQLSADRTGWIGLARDEIEWSEIESGQPVFKNDDPQLNRRLRQTFSGGDPVRRQPVDFRVVARVGQPLEIHGTLVGGSAKWAAESVSVSGETALAIARKHPVTTELLREKLGRLGGTGFQMRHLQAEIDGEPMVPMAMLNELRRSWVRQLTAQLDRAPTRQIDIEAGKRLLDFPVSVALPNRALEQNLTQLSVMCRTLDQVQAACASQVSWVLVDFQNIRLYRQAIETAREHGLPIAVASVRIQKPGEMGLLKVLDRHAPDAILARNLAALDYFNSRGLMTIADFSLNVTNHLSAQWIFDRGASRVTASYDLNRSQLLDLVRSHAPGALEVGALEVVVHQHMPMFHMEHCVFCSVLSPGTDKTNCGRPCDDHIVQLRDRVGAEHPLHADVACRNTIYNGTPQSGAEMIETLLQHGVSWFRVELLEESDQAAQRTIKLYQRCLSGEVSGADVWRTLQATNRLGVTRGTMEAERNPLAIL